MRVNSLSRFVHSLSLFVHSLSRFHLLSRFVHSHSGFVHSLSRFHSLSHFVHSLLLTFAFCSLTFAFCSLRQLTFALRQVPKSPLLVLAHRVATGRRRSSRSNGSNGNNESLPTMAAYGNSDNFSLSSEGAQRTIREQAAARFLELPNCGLHCREGALVGCCTCLFWTWEAKVLQILGGLCR